MMVSFTVPTRDLSLSYLWSASNFDTDLSPPIYCIINRSICLLESNQYEMQQESDSCIVSVFNISSSIQSVYYLYSTLIMIYCLLLAENPLILLVTKDVHITLIFSVNRCHSYSSSFPVFCHTTITSLNRLFYLFTMTPSFLLAGRKVCLFISKCSSVSTCSIRKTAPLCESEDYIRGLSILQF